MQVMTVGNWLLANYQKREFRLSGVQDLHEDANGMACFCADCVGERGLKKQIDLDYMSAWMGPGMADLRGIAESEGEKEGVTEEWFRRKRGGLVAQVDWTAAKVDALTIPEFTAALKSPASPTIAEPKTQAGKRKSNNKSQDDAIISALCTHHKYSDRSCDNWEPIGNNELAKLAGCSPGTVSGFWKKMHRTKDRKGNYDDYERSCANRSLSYKLAVWRGDLSYTDVRELLAEERSDDD